jgi:hypothetical protein
VVVRSAKITLKIRVLGDELSEAKLGLPKCGSIFAVTITRDLRIHVLEFRNFIDLD